ncbi:MULTISPECIES: DUF4235 domain-containing protein [Streptomyces]|uniref:DUF4235 domain-containing protein n=1 Tax=Streptomyces TaxID=1883 RepID=UPI001316E8E6|nr:MULTISPECIES: DUF4235 domain-containing protein [Streptomyces]QGZ52370.1 DUF4235 domain-containing protein [Streptomyces sp. QHH-9511]
MKMSKIMYKPVGFLTGAAAGMVAAAVFRQAWKLLGHEDEAPDATDEDRSWREILLAAAVQGAIFAAVKAAVDRSGATAVRKATGTWPG